MKLKLLLCLLTTLLLGACASTGYHDRYDRGYGYDRGYDSQYDRGYASCYDCGVVQRIETLYGDGRTSGGGAVLGGIVGGALGNQVGKGDGRKAATVAGAVAGAVAGNAIERNAREGAVYRVHVRLDNGRMAVVEQRDLNGVRPGARVIIDHGEAHLY